MSQEWIQRQLHQYQLDFDKADKDKSGSLSLSEVHNVLKSQGFTGGEEKAGILFKHLDLSGDKGISRSEFNEAMSKISKPTHQQMALIKMFRTLDRDDSGYLTFGEIKAAAKKENESWGISNVEVFDLLNRLRKDDDFKLSYEEVVGKIQIDSDADKMCTLFTELDADKNGYLTREEIIAACKCNFELQLSMDKIWQVLNQLEIDDDGKLSYKEFLDAWKKQ